SVRRGSQLHSVAWQDGTLYVASTGTDEVLGLRVEGGRVLSEEVVWRPPEATDRVDRHHVNSVAIHDGRLHAAGYWLKAGSFWRDALDGRVIDTSSGRELIDGLHHPHSLTAIGAELYLCESASRVMRSLDDARRVELSGYARGLCTVGPW